MIGGVGRSFPFIGLGEEPWVAEPENVDPAVLAVVDAELMLKVSSRDLHVSLVFEPVSP